MIKINTRFVGSVIVLATFSLILSGCEMGQTKVAESKTNAKQVETKTVETIPVSEKATKTMSDTNETSKKYTKPSDEKIKAKLTKLQYKVTQHEGTEPPFENEYWNNKEAGLYVDVVSGEPLFSSKDKYKSGTGWPSFTQPISKEFIEEKVDRKLFSTRTEIRSKFGDSHLGHVFPDGPEPTGMRYCMNSAAMRFIPVEKLEAEGYGEYKKLFEEKETK